MKKKLRMLSAVLSICLMAGCSSTPGTAEKPNAYKGESYYATCVQKTGEYDSDQLYLEIAQRSRELLTLLEDNVDAFVMDAYNYQLVDNEGTLLYSNNNHTLPIEMSAGGYCINVSPNYFNHNPIETANGESIAQQIVLDDNIQNILVPEKFAAYENELLEEYLRLFYFEKVEVANIYNESVGAAWDSTNIDDLAINIIYVQDNQEYFTYRSELAKPSDSIITDPIVRIYTGNTHVSYAHSYMTQFVSFYSDADSPEQAYAQIREYINQVGAGESVQRVENAMDFY